MEEINMEPVVRIQCAIRKRIARSVVLRKRSPFYKAAMLSISTAANYPLTCLSTQTKPPANIFDNSLVPGKP